MQSPDTWLRSIKGTRKCKSYHLQQMLPYIHETTCRRERFIAYFGEKLVDKPIHCCDQDGAALFGTEKTITPPVKKSSWQAILLNLF